MPLTVEDGTGLAEADALASLAYVDGYHVAFGNSGWSGDDSAKEAAIRRASAYLSHSFRWKGYRLNGRTQALAWPRTGVVDADGYDVPSDEVPDEVQQATAEVALRELAEPGAMNPVHTPADKKVLVAVEGIRWEHVGRTGTDAERPVLMAVRDLLNGLVVDGGSSAVKWLARA